jgi:AraC-like DNA-binding protein
VSERAFWAGALFLGDGWAVYSGLLRATTPHAHHAFQLAQATEGKLALRGAEDAADVPCEVALIGPSVPHAIGEGASRAVMAYVDPDTLVGRRLRAAVPSRTRAHEWRDAGAPLLGCDASLPLEWPAARDRVRHLTAALGADVAPARATHPALGRARAWLVAHLHDEVVISLDAVATAVGLSGDRLSHLLNDELGIGLRPLVLWLRLQVAAREIAMNDGPTMSRAAAAAGFADAAHMTRTFRRMFGVTPTEVVGAVRWVLPPPGAPA